MMSPSPATQPLPFEGRFGELDPPDWSERHPGLEDALKDALEPHLSEDSAFEGSLTPTRGGYRAALTLSELTLETTREDGGVLEGHRPELDCLPPCLYATWCGGGDSGTVDECHDGQEGALELDDDASGVLDDLVFQSIGAAINGPGSEGEILVLKAKTDLKGAALALFEEHAPMPCTYPLVLYRNRSLDDLEGDPTALELEVTYAPV